MHSPTKRSLFPHKGIHARYHRKIRTNGKIVDQILSTKNSSPRSCERAYPTWSTPAGFRLSKKKGRCQTANKTVTLVPQENDLSLRGARMLAAINQLNEAGGSMDVHDLEALEGPTITSALRRLEKKAWSSLEAEKIATKPKLIPFPPPEHHIHPTNSNKQHLTSSVVEKMVAISCMASQVRENRGLFASGRKESSQKGSRPRSSYQRSLTPFSSVGESTIW